MSSPDSLEHVTETASPTSRRSVLADLDFSKPARRAAEFVDRPDFPQCALGEHIDIGGVTGVVVEIVRQSLKVQSPEGSVQSFNCNRLRTIYGVRPDHAEDAVRAEAVAEAPRPAAARPAPVPAVAATRRDFIASPDFTTVIQPIAAFASRPDFPKCLFGAHVDIVGHVGVVVELVKDSVKVQSQNGPIRSFNAPMLRKLYGTA